jgi:hypothetical protein
MSASHVTSSDPRCPGIASGAARLAAPLASSFALALWIWYCRCEVSATPDWYVLSSVVKPSSPGGLK